MVALLRDGAARVGPLPAEINELGEALRPYAYVGVPLHVHGRVAGVMWFGTTDDLSRREYSEANVKMMVEEFARRVSVALENAQLLRRAFTNRLKDESSALLRTSSARRSRPRWVVADAVDRSAQCRQDAAAKSKRLNAMRRRRPIVDDILDVAQTVGSNIQNATRPLRDGEQVKAWRQRRSASRFRSTLPRHHGDCHSRQSGSTSRSYEN